MGLVGVWVANFNIILAESIAAAGSFQEIAHKVLRSKTIPDYDTRVSYTAGEYVLRCFAWCDRRSASVSAPHRTADPPHLVLLLPLQAQIPLAGQQRHAIFVLGGLGGRPPGAVFCAGHRAVAFP